MTDKETLLNRIDYAAFYRSQGIRFVGQPDAEGNTKAHCPFHDDRTPSLSIQLKSPGLYHCFGCEHQGDVLTFVQVIDGVSFPEALMKLTDFAGLTNGRPTPQPARPVDSHKPLEAELEPIQQIDAWVEALLQDENWFRDLSDCYGLSRETVVRHMLGFDGKYFTIPLPGTKQGSRMAVKRHRRGQVPKARNPAGVPVQLYGVETLRDAPNGSLVIITGGELKRLLLVQMGFLAVSGTGGEGTFLPEWIEHFRGFNVAIIYDVDEAGQAGARKVAERLLPAAQSVRIVYLPLSDAEDSKDVTDWVKAGHTAEELRQLIEETEAQERPDGPTVSVLETAFSPISLKELLDILGRTIKKDEANKLITFLCELSAYTEDAQFNIINNAPSSSGKSYIPTEVSALFPAEDVLAIGYCSPTAFFHDVGQYVKEVRGYVVDLSRKILIFLDQPHTLLLQHLRPLLSHDKKELLLKITDKSQKAGLRTKNVLLRGFPAVIFCTSNLKIDEQEATRSLLLSPETHQEKIREAIHQRADKEADAETYHAWLESDASRQRLKARIAAIKAAGITHIKIPDVHLVKERFFLDRATLKPRHMRDIGRVMSLVKAWALLNLWHRNRTGSVIEANREDIEEAFRLWDQVAKSQELNLPPYLYDFFHEVLLPLYLSKGSGLTRQEILQGHYRLYSRFMPDFQLRQQVLPMLEAAGLIVQEADPQDRRRMLVVPVSGNSESSGGVGGDSLVGTSDIVS